MTRINPFDKNLFNTQSTGGANSVNAPQKVDGQNIQPNDGNLKAGAAAQASEDSLVDTTAMADDLGDFDMSDFSGENDEISGTEQINGAEENNGAGQNSGDEEAKDEILSEAAQMTQELVDKRFQQ